MYTIGVDLGGTNIKVGLCDAELNIIDKDSVPTGAQREAEEIVKDMAELTRKIIERNSLDIKDVEYFGIAAPGTANTATGVIEYTNNLPFKDFHIADIFKKYLPIERIYVANDANAAALGEAAAGSAKNEKNVIMITLGTGVGSGIIIDGKIFSGSVNFAGGEIGHTVIRMGGRLCSCGRRGCWEAYASASALTVLTKERMKGLAAMGVPSKLFECAEKEGKVSARTAFDAKRAGDPYGAELVREYIENLAAGLTNTINIFQPDVICIGGGLSNEKDDLISPIKEIVKHEQYSRHAKKKTEIRIATLGNDAGIVGAACLGR